MLRALTTDNGEPLDMTTNLFKRGLKALCALLLTITAPGHVTAAEEDVFAFDDFPLEELLQYPDWF